MNITDYIELGALILLAAILLISIVEDQGLINRLKG
jgi:hypothetical protein